MLFSAQRMRRPQEGGRRLRRILGAQMKCFAIGFGLLLCGLAAQTGSAQSASGTNIPRPPAPAVTAQKPLKPQLTVRSNLVLVPVTVKDATGHLVADLQQGDFRIFQDGVEQHITNFWDRPFPMSAVVLLDDDLPQKEAKTVQQSLDSIAAGFSASDEVALVRFDEYPTKVMGFTRSNNELFAKLKQIRTNEKDALGSRYPDTPSFPMTDPPRDNGHTAGGAADIPILGTDTNGVTKHIDDAVHYAAEMLRTQPNDRRKIIFIVSDGTNDRNNKWSFKNTLELLLASNITVYAIAVDSPLDVLTLQGTGRLAQYAVPTGGDVLRASNAAEIERLYSRLTDEARNEYTIGFQPSRTNGRGNYHTLEVRVERPGLYVTARQGYFAQFPR